MKVERLRDNKKIVYGVIVGLAIILTVTLFVSRAAYRVTATLELANETVKSTPYDFKIEIMYIEDSSGTIEYNNKKYKELTGRMPDSGYKINSRSYCKTKDGATDNEAKLYTNSNGEHVISNVKKNSNCVIYFDKDISRARDYILANKQILERTSENKDFNVPFGDDTTGKIYKAEDDDGYTYYYAGNPSDNWVKFGGYYWRIIRVNGDGTVRMIYQGKVSEGPQITGEGTQIGTSVFNTNYDRAEYVGYQYELDKVHGLYESGNRNSGVSAIYTYLNNWFENESGLKSEQYFNKIDTNAGFCNDRTPSSSNTSIDGIGGTGTTTTYYGSYVRLFSGGIMHTSSSVAATPTFKCSNNKDLQTYINSNRGNKNLINPVGLITADEVNYAGLVISDVAVSITNYLYTNRVYWTITPFGYVNNIANTFIVNPYGAFGSNYVTDNRGVRPVINLKADIGLTGSGTTSDPYEVLPDILTNKSVLTRSTANKDFNVPLVDDTTGKIYKTQDDDGTSYYYAGNPSDNWVEFGGYYWRIIRINGDGSYRMIYQGTSANATGEGTQTGTSAFNSSYNNNMYVGYFYTSNQLRGLGTASTIYTALNNWFASSNIKQGSAYFDKIDPNAGFCGDRTPSSTNTPTVSNGLNTGDGKGGTGTTTTYYGAYLRLAPGGVAVTSSTTTVTPSLTCAHSDDLYTYSGANQGNKKLANPVGLITGDEVACAGMVYGASSSGNYLDTDSHYWTMSPYYYHSSTAYPARVFYVHSSGYLVNGSIADGTFSVRPVINLKANTKFSGSGITSNPYRVVG
ncbi:MAG: hypothetical protein NC483_01395 [Ruminococcus sp.]|nr:hypothetical protein [Ruminococcus sp.]